MRFWKSQLFSQPVLTMEHDRLCENSGFLARKRSDWGLQRGFTPFDVEQKRTFDSEMRSGSTNTSYNIMQKAIGGAPRRVENKSERDSAVK